MPLSQQHFTSAALMPNLAGRKLASVDSGLVAVSLSGKTILWSTGFSGCIGLVMCGLKPGGALVHLNQRIQTGERDLELALKTSAEFAKGMLGGQPTDALIYYGDPVINLGRDGSLDEQKVKRVLGCDRLIDLRRTSDETPLG